MAASDFKQRCSAVLDQVATDRVPVLVTKRGRPVARLVPLDVPVEPRSTMGSVTVLVDDDALLFSTGEAWETAG